MSNSKKVSCITTSIMLLSTIFLTFIFIVLCLYLLKIIIIWERDFKLLSKLPGPPNAGYCIGNMTCLQASPEIIFQYLRKFASEFYPIYSFYAFHKAGCNILDPADCELILSNSMHNEKGYIYKPLQKWLKFGLLTSKDEKWQTRRRILTPAFHFNILQEFIQVFNEDAEDLVQILKKESEKSYIYISSHVSQFTLKTISETAMGTKLLFKNKKELKYKKAVFDMGQILIYRISHPWCIEEIANMFTNPSYLKELKVRKTLHNFTKEVIEEREKNFGDIQLPKGEHDVYRGKKRLAMLDLLLSAKRNEGIIDDEGIHEEVDTFMFEGHDTTAVALNFILMLISNHKDIQNLIVQEMNEVLGDLHKQPTYNDLQNLKYMERCIKESLRLYPSVPLISRKLGQDLITHSGYFLPNNTEIVIHIYDIHRNPDIYRDPEKFDPDRFLPENSQGRHPYAYLPFSAGPRNCIGQKFAMLELKTTLCAILGNFILEPIDTPETIVLVVDIVLRTKDDIKIRFVSRK